MYHCVYRQFLFTVEIWNGDHLSYPINFFNFFVIQAVVIVVLWALGHKDKHYTWKNLK